MNTLDISHEKAKGLDLHKLILQAVKDSQSLILKPHYDELLLTQKQFDDLIDLKFGGMQEMYMDSFYMYNTGISVMEVRVKDPKILEVEA